MTRPIVKRLQLKKTDPLIGEKLGDYEIHDVVGKGGMGHVYKGYDDNLDRYAAVKVFDAEGVIGDEEEEYRQRFQREARAIARLRHPNIVGVYQFGQAENLYYMAMVLIEGRDLRDIIRTHLKRNTYLKPQAVVRIITDVALALDYAHSQGVIHRDVKPSNIMVTGDGHAVLTDFGLALSMLEGTIGSTFGSVHYIAPEQALNSANAVPQSDFYSLGIVLYEMLTNRVPFDDQTAMTVALRHLNEAPPPPRLFNPKISPETEALILRLLDKEPTQRFEKGEDIITALEQALGVTDQDDDTRQVVLPNEVLASRSDGPLYTEPNTYTKPDLPTLPEKQEGESTVIPPSMTTPPPVKRRPRLYAVFAFIVLGVISVSALLLSGNVPGEAAGVIEATNQAVVSPVSSPIPPASPTPVPATPQAIVAAEDAQVELIYDNETLVLHNRSDEPVDLSGISFVQVIEDGPDLIFQARRWDGGSASIRELPAGDCFQVWTTEVAFVEVPDYCGLRHKWDQSSFPRWFWISETAGSVFEIRRSGQVLATCLISDQECLVDVRRSD